MRCPILWVLDRLAPVPALPPPDEEAAFVRGLAAGRLYAAGLIQVAGRRAMAIYGPNAVELFAPLLREVEALSPHERMWADGLRLGAVFS